MKKSKNERKKGNGVNGNWVSILSKKVRDWYTTTPLLHVVPQIDVHQSHD